MNWENTSFERESCKQLDNLQDILNRLNRAFDGIIAPQRPEDGDCQAAADLMDELISESAELFDLLSAHCVSAPAPGAFLAKVIFNHRQVG